MYQRYTSRVFCCPHSEIDEFVLLSTTTWLVHFWLLTLTLRFFPYLISHSKVACFPKKHLILGEYVTILLRIRKLRQTAKSIMDYFLEDSSNTSFAMLLRHFNMQYCSFRCTIFNFELF